MIRRLAILVLAVICLLVSTTKADVENEDIGKTLKMLQDLATSIIVRKQIGDDMYKIGMNYDLKALAQKSDYKYKVIVTNFLDSYESGMLPRGRIFSQYYGTLLPEAVLVFNVLFYAPSLWELICIIAWAFIHINQFQLIYALRTALRHRNDTASTIVIPPYYESDPQIFYNSDVLKQIDNFKISLIDKGESNESITFTVVANYTNWYIVDTTDCEYSMTYFMEDVGFSNWYVNYHQRFPFWLSGEEYKLLDRDRRGGIYSFIHMWLLARYNLERLSNKLDEVINMNWDKPIEIGYSPYMNYGNGMQFPRRKEHSIIPDRKNTMFQNLKNIDTRINDAIDSGYVFTPDAKYVSINNEKGINVIGNLIQGNNDSLNIKYYSSYDGMARSVFGFSSTPQTDYEILPSALEYDSTCLRDPMYYRLVKKIGDLILKFKKGLPPYTREILILDGVMIKSVRIIEQNVVTYFEWFDTVISKIPFGCQNKQSAIIMVRQYRLNHKPVTFNMTIISDREMTVMIRVSMGPVVNVWGKAYTEAYRGFYLIDYFIRNLKKGENIIQECVNSTRGGSLYGFPDNLIFPKGWVGGMPVRFHFIVSEYNGSNHSPLDTDMLIRDNKPLGFPMDRPLPKYNMPNTAMLPSIIYHIE